MDRKTVAIANRTEQNARIFAGSGPVERPNERTFCMESSYTGTPTFTV